MDAYIRKKTKSCCYFFYFGNLIQRNNCKFVCKKTTLTKKKRNICSISILRTCEKFFILIFVLLSFIAVSIREQVLLFCVIIDSIINNLKLSRLVVTSIFKVFTDRTVRQLVKTLINLNIINKLYMVFW